jgi:hypothetical protein
MTKDATIIIKVESELKSFLEGIASDKGMSTGAYCRYVLQRGLDAIYKRNLELRAIEAKLRQ